MEQTKDQFNKLKVGDIINVEYICHGNKTKYLVRVVKLINDSFAGSAIEIIPKIPFITIWCVCIGKRGWGVLPS